MQSTLRFTSTLFVTLLGKSFSRCSPRFLHSSSTVLNMPMKGDANQKAVGKKGSIYEPDYLDATGPEMPLYDLLNIQIKGYDFPVLEKFAKYVHHTADHIGLGVEEAWATPCKKLRITKLKPESTVIETEYALNLYERNVQIADVPATLLPVFINVIEAALPAGITLRVVPHLPEHTEIRYVPDLQLKELRAQLDGMRGGGGGGEKK